MMAFGSITRNPLIMQSTCRTGQRGVFAFVLADVRPRPEAAAADSPRSTADDTAATDRERPGSARSPAFRMAIPEGDRMVQISATRRRAKVDVLPVAGAAQSHELFCENCLNAEPSASTTKCRVRLSERG